MSKKLIPIAGAIAGSLLWATSAGAVTISIGAGENGSAATLITSGTGSATASFTEGAYDVNLTTGLAAIFPDIFNSSSQDQVSVAPDGKSLNIWVTASNIMSPTGLTSLLSTLTSNTLPPGWNENLKTYLDPGNGVFTQVDLLCMQGFTGIGVGSCINPATLTAPYSITELFTINATSIGSANNTIDVAAAPLPATLPLFASGLLGFWGWSRKRKASASLADVSLA